MDESGRKALLVVHTGKRGAREAKAQAEALEAGGMTLLRRECAPSKMNDLIRSMRHEVDCVVLAGSDAMMSVGGVALRDTGLPLGVLPVGPDIDLARRLGIPPSLEAAAIILRGHTRRLDLGSVNGWPFFNVASVGLTVKTARQLNRAARRPIGALAYGLKALGIAARSRRFSALIRCGSAVSCMRTMQITVGNGRAWTGGMQSGGMPPGSEVPGEAHMLGVYSLEATGRWELLALSHAFTAGAGDKVPQARITHGPVVEVVTRLPLPVTADGEVVALTPARFSILRDAVTIFVPQPPELEIPPEAWPDAVADDPAAPA